MRRKKLGNGWRSVNGSSAIDGPYSWQKPGQSSRKFEAVETTNLGGMLLGQAKKYIRRTWCLWMRQVAAALCLLERETQGLELGLGNAEHANFRLLVLSLEKNKPAVRKNRLPSTCIAKRRSSLGKCCSGTEAESPPATQTFLVATFASTSESPFLARRVGKVAKPIGTLPPCRHPCSGNLC